MISPVSGDSGNFRHHKAPNSAQDQALSVAIVDRFLERRNAVASAVCALKTVDRVPRITTLQEAANAEFLLSQGFDVVLLAVDGETGPTVKTIEALCHSDSVTLVVYATSASGDLLIRCMRAGVREFLVYPFAPAVVEETFRRLLSRERLKPDTGSVTGKSFVFVGSKGGSGVTTAACNFAIAMARESKRSTVLIDLDLPLGDAALNLGFTGGFSTVDALRDSDRLDPFVLRQLVSQHSSGLFVLPAPGRSNPGMISNRAIDRLLAVASKTFEYVVVDAGCRWDLAATHMFDSVSAIYLVTQIGIAELRNANRLIGGCLTPHTRKLQIVLNRYKRGMFGSGEGAMEGAIQRQADWRIPNDYKAVCEMQLTAVPLVLKESKMQRAIQTMARIALELPGEQQKTRFGIFRMASGV